MFRSYDLCKCWVPVRSADPHRTLSSDQHQATHIANVEGQHFHTLRLAHIVRLRRLAQGTHEELFSTNQRGPGYAADTESGRAIAAAVISGQ